MAIDDENNDIELTKMQKRLFYFSVLMLLIATILFTLQIVYYLHFALMGMFSMVIFFIDQSITPKQDKLFTHLRRHIVKEIKYTKEYFNKKHLNNNK